MSTLLSLLCLQADVDVLMFALKLSAGRLLALCTQSLPRGLLGSLQGMLEHRSQTEHKAWASMGAQSHGTGCFLQCSFFSRGMALYQGDLATPAGDLSSPVSSEGSPAKGRCCITSKHMEAGAEHRASLIHCMASLLHHFCPCRYRLWDNLCYLCTESTTFWCHSSAVHTVIMWK